MIQVPDEAITAGDVRAAEAAATDVPADEFAIVEIFGHRRLAGRVMEVERFGAKLLRIDVPKEGDFAKGFTTQFYGGASLFSVTPCDLAMVIKHNKPYDAPRLYHAPADPDDSAGDEPPDEF
jgi:hypothetical protein